MSSLSTRVSRMEQRFGSTTPGRIVAVKSTGATDDDVAKFLADRDVGFDDRKDLLAHIRLFAADAPQGIELLNVTPLKGGNRVG